MCQENADVKGTVSVKTNLEKRNTGVRGTVLLASY